MQFAQGAQDFCSAARFRDAREALFASLPARNKGFQRELAQLRSPDFRTRAEAARALGRRCNSAALPPLICALQDPNFLVHIRAEVAIYGLWGRCGKQPVAKAIRSGVKVMRDVDCFWRAWDLDCKGTWLRMYADKESCVRAALALFTQASELDPNHAHACFLRANVLCHLSDFPSAMRLSERAVALDPYHFGAWKLRAMCALRAGDLESAQRYFDASLAISPHLTFSTEAAMYEEVQLRLRDKRRGS